MQPFIKTRGTTFEQQVKQSGYESLEEAHRSVAQRLLASYQLPVIADWTPRGDVVAYVNEGRWVADCPQRDCAGAELVDPEWPLFVCCSGCGCGPHCVIFPKDREKIEAALVKRQVPRTRNWLPGETVSDLQRENKAHEVS